MRDAKHTFTLTALAIALMGVYGPSSAGEVMDDNELMKPSSSVTVGIGVWSSERPQMGIYDGMSEDDAYLLFDADLKKRDDATGTWQSLTVHNLGLDNREIRAEYQQQGRQGGSIEYNQTSRDTPYTINSGLLGIGTDTQTVTNIAPGTGTNLHLGMERNKLGFNFFKYLMPGLEFKINFSNETKEGDRHWGRGGAPEFAAEPIDWTTRQLEATLNFVGERLQVTGGYYGSWFENANHMVTSIGASTYYLSLPLDNQAHQLFVSGAYQFTPKTQGTFKVAYTRATQDEYMPTYGVGAIPPSTSAPSSLDGEVNTTLVQLGLTSRPTPKLNIVANLRYHDVDDQTPAWLVIDTDNNPATTTNNVHSTPWSYETLSGKVEGNYNLAPGYNLIAGIDHSQQDRSLAGFDSERYVPYRAELDETTYRIQLRKSLSETINGSLAYLRSERDGSAYSTAAATAGGGAAIQDLISPIHISDRERDKWRLTMDWMPSERMNLQVNYENSQDDYTGDGRTRGLIDGNAWLFSADASYAINKDWQLTGWYSHDYTEAYQINGASVAPNRFARLNDTGDSVGVGLQGKVNAKLKMGADLQWTRTVSRYDLTTLADITNKVTSLKLFAEYALKKNGDLRFDVVHERWNTDDWTWQFSGGTPFIYGAATDGTMVITDPQQNTTFVGMSYRYKFQ